MTPDTPTMLRKLADVDITKLALGRGWMAKAQAAMRQAADEIDLHRSLFRLLDPFNMTREERAAWDKLTAGDKGHGDDLEHQNADFVSDFDVEGK